MHLDMNRYLITRLAKIHMYMPACKRTSTHQHARHTRACINPHKFYHICTQTHSPRKVCTHKCTPPGTQMVVFTRAQALTSKHIGTREISSKEHLYTGAHMCACADTCPPHVKQGTWLLSHVHTGTGAHRPRYPGAVR